MSRILLVVALAVVGTGVVGFAFPSQDSGEQAVREAVEQYFKGIDEHDQEALARAFHPEARIKAMLGGYWEMPFNEWRGFADRPAPADADQRTNTIHSIDISGSAAVVKTELVWPNVRYLDYLSLLNVDGEWKIVSKIFHQDPR